MTNILYRFFDANSDLLYVGITMNLAERWRAHRTDKAWIQDVATITIKHYSSREELMEAEQRAIKAEHPKWNKQHNLKQKTSAIAITHRPHNKYSWWRSRPRLLQAYVTFFQLCNDELIEQGSDSFSEFLALFSQSFGLIDWCRTCHQQNVDPNLIPHPPLSINPDGVCFYACERKHVWKTWWLDAEGISAPVAT